MVTSGGADPVWQTASSTAGEWAAPTDVDWDDAPAIAAVVEIDGPSARVVGDAPEVDGRDWWFRTSTDSRHLRLESLSFPAQVYIDGVEVAASRSSFLPLELDLPGRDCELVIVCRSLTEWLATKRPRGRWRSSMTGTQALRWARVSLVGRVAAYAGHAPDVGFSGLELGDVPVLRDVTVATRLAGDGATPPPYGEVRVTGVVASNSPRDLTLTLRYDGRTVAQQAISGAGAFDVRLGVDQPHLWWPHGYGAASCYEVHLAEGDRSLLCRTVGFRALTLDRDDGRFAFSVNGVSVFARGAVLTGPADAAVIDELADAGATMVRVAGGTTPASAEVWERCARRGIMVWHDCMVSTFDVPDELHELVGDELRSLLSRYGSNPALAVVCGGSETRQQPEMMGLEPERRAQPLIEQLLPNAVDEWQFDDGSGPGDVAYVESSPTSGVGSSVLRPDDGPSHWFGVGGYRQPVAAVRGAGVRFASECLAFANPPDEVTDLVAVAEASEEWKRGVTRDRGADWDFEDVRDHYVAELFGIDPAALRRSDPARYLECGRAAVAAAMTTCFSWWRESTECGGALVLSAGDLQPGAGWGLLDSDGRSKAPLRALRRFWSPLALTVRDDGLAGLAITAYNDTSQVVSGWIELRASNARSQITVDGRVPVQIRARGSLGLHDGDVVGRFTDLAFAYRFGNPVADAVDVRLVSDDGAVLARDAHIIVQPPIEVTAPTATSPRPTPPLVTSPRPAPPLVSAVPDRAPDAAMTSSDALEADEASPQVIGVHDRAAGVLRLTATAALRWVSIDFPGYRPADDYFHLAAGIEYAVRLTADGSGERRRGELRSIDLPAPAAISEQDGEQ